jgi:hypothetical protein
VSIASIKEERLKGEAFLRELPEVSEFSLIGSAMYLPAEAVNDVDFAVLLKDGQQAIGYIGTLEAQGWEWCGDYDGVGGTWGAVRRENLNLMVTHDRQWYEDYKLAMEVCKVLRLENKEDRIAVCRVVRDKLPAESVRPSIPLAPEGWPA